LSILLLCPTRMDKLYRFLIDHSKFLILSLWIVSSLWVVCHHEIWRDEMRALTIATLHTNWSSLIQDLRNEGHPILWYAVLKIAHYFYAQTAVLQVVAYIVGFLTAALLLYYWRLPLYMRCLYLFSSILFWENTVMCRNYGIASLCIVLFAILYERKAILWSVFILALLTQTNVLGLLVAACLFLYMLLDGAFPSWYKHLRYYGAATLMIVHVWFFFYVSLPDADSSVSKVGTHDFSHLLMSVAQSFTTFQHVFVKGQALLNFSLALFVLSFFWGNWRLMLVTYLCLGAMDLLSKEVNLLSVRHIGVFFTFFLCFVQIYRNQNIAAAHPAISLLHKRLLPTILVALVALNVYQCTLDLNEEMSSSKSLATFIKNDPKYAHALIIAEPDYLIEALPYYLQNNFYIPRERTFASFTHFTNQKENHIALSDILFVHDSLIGLNPSAHTLFIAQANIPMGYDTILSHRVYAQNTCKIDRQSSMRLHFLREFRAAVGDENYALFEIK
jgi:hypothetical protein